MPSRRSCLRRAGARAPGRPQIATTPSGAALEKKTGTFSSAATQQPLDEAASSPFPVSTKSKRSRNAVIRESPIAAPWNARIKYRRYLQQKSIHDSHACDEVACAECVCGGLRRVRRVDEMPGRRKARPRRPSSGSPPTTPRSARRRAASHDDTRRPNSAATVLRITARSENSDDPRSTPRRAGACPEGRTSRTPLPDCCTPPISRLRHGT